MCIFILLIIAQNTLAVRALNSPEIIIIHRVIRVTELENGLHKKCLNKTKYRGDNILDIQPSTIHAPSSTTKVNVGR